MTPPLLKDKTGLTALMLVVIIGGVSLIFVTGLALQSIAARQMTDQLLQATAVHQVTDGCAEEALGRLRVSSTYAGGVLEIADGSCILSVVPGGAARIIHVTGTLDQYTAVRTIEVTHQGSALQIDSWQ